MPHAGSIRTARLLLAAVALVASLVNPSAIRAADEPLPTDPALLTGVLDNGLAYMIRKHGNPEGRVSVWLQVGSGSLNETEETRGIAHFLEHMAFNGSANFPPGSVAPYFQSLGLTFGRDLNAFTGFEQTTYLLTLPDTRAETLDTGLLFLSDVAFRLTLAPAEIESERQIILEEKRTGAGARQRVRDYVYERLAPQSTFGRRLPLGIEPTIGSVMAKDFQEYYSRWYVSANMTVIVVGDCDPGLVADLIKRRFADGSAVPRPTDRDVGIEASPTTRAIVAGDPELTEARVSIVRVEPSRGPTTTVAQRRRDLVELMGTWAFNRRMRARLAEDEVSFSDARASVYQLARAIRIVTVDASGQPEMWRAMLTDLGRELQRARLRGFTGREMHDAGASLVADAEEAFQREATLPARALIERINGAVARREPAMSAGQRLELLKRLLPGITAREVSEAFETNFAPTSVTFVAELPSGVDVPSEADLIALGRAAVDVTPETPTEVARPTALLSELPAGGRMLERAEHDASGVMSAWLDNGVRVHHRFMDQRKNEATLAITLAGGEIQETAANRGITRAAALAWSRPATSALSSVQIQDLLTGKKVQVRGDVGGDTMSLIVSGDPADLEVGVQLAYLLLTDPVIERGALRQWKQRETQAIAARRVEPRGALAEATAEGFHHGDEPRTRPLQAEQVQQITPEAALAWLRKVITEAPVEVAVVGDINRAAAMGLVERYLGSLPPRDRIGDRTMSRLRATPRAVGPIDIRRTIDTLTPQALVLVGFFGADIRNVRDVRLLSMASRVLTTRMAKTIREEKQLVYSISAVSRPATQYPGFGLFTAQASTDPAKGEALATALDEMYAAFAKEGPTEDEMLVARRQIANLLDESMKDPDFWITRLSTLHYRGLSLTDVVEAPEAYQQFTAQDVRDVFGTHWRLDTRFRFVITPRDARGG